MKSIALFSLILLASNSWAQENQTYYSHTDQKGVSFHSTIDPNAANTTIAPGMQSGPRTRQVEEFSMVEVEYVLSYTESKLEIATKNNDTEAIREMNLLIDRLLKRKAELNQ